MKRKEYDRLKANLDAHTPTADTRRKVEIMVFTDTPLDLIASNIGIGSQVLRRKYRSELKYGKQRIATEIKTKFVAAALDGDKVALSRVALSIATFGTVNAPPPGASKGNGEALDLTQYSDQQLSEILSGLQKAGADNGDPNGTAAPPRARDLGAPVEQPARKMH